MHSCPSTPSIPTNNATLPHTLFSLHEAREEAHRLPALKCVFVVLEVCAGPMRVCAFGGLYARALTLTLPALMLSDARREACRVNSS